MRETLKNHSILYAEDDKALQGVTVEYLQRYFKEVYVASDGKEALFLYHKYQPNAVLLDIDMPYTDGLSVANQIRKKNQSIPILMLTAFTDTAMLLEATELHLTKYLLKPIDAKTFKEALEKVAQELQLVHSHVGYLDDEHTWESDKEILCKGKVPVELLQKERVLLSLFMKYRKHCVSFEEIMAVVWAEDFDGEISIESVKYQVSQLRKKLPKNCIQNVYAKGYRLI